jgi:hypothetical protein
MVKERTQTISAANDERCQVLPSKVIFNETVDYEVFRNNAECHYGQIGADYLFDSRQIHNASQSSSRVKED